MNQPKPKQRQDQAKNTIHEIVECAIKWVSADADNPDTPSPEWQGVIPLIKSAPDMRDTITDGIAAAEQVVCNWERGDLAGTVRELKRWMETARYRHAGA